MYRNLGNAQPSSHSSFATDYLVSRARQGNRVIKILEVQGLMLECHVDRARNLGS